MERSIEMIRVKLAQLTALDTQRRTFGAFSHQYQQNPVLTEAQVDAFETRFFIRLPEEYRLYLLHIANGGTGPFYGLYELEYEDNNTPKLAEPFGYTHQAPLNVREIDQQIPPQVSDEDREKLMERLYDSAEKGIIFLATEGCGMYSVLVVNGEAYGTVWFYDLANDGGVFPLTSPEDGKPMRFLEWFEIWLDKSIQALTEGKGLMSYSEFIE